MIKEFTNLETIITGCQKGKIKYQELLFKQFYGYAMGVSLRYTTSKENAEEVVNDSFIKVFKGIKKLNNAEVFKGWLRRIVINTAIDSIRKDKKHSVLVDIQNVSEESCNTNIIDHLNAEDILELFDELPEIQRVIFNMHEIEGYKHDEIAKMLEITASISRSYLSRAKNRIRIIFKQRFEKEYEAV